MFSNGNVPVEMQRQQQQEPPTIEGLQKTVQRLQQYLELFRQQRDNAVIMITNLQADLALANHQVTELEGKLKEVAPQMVEAQSRFSDFEEGVPN